MDGAVVEGEDGRAGKSQQNGGVGGDEKLGAPLGGAVNLRQQCQLPLGGEGRLRLVKQKNAGTAQPPLEQAHKAFPVGPVVIPLGGMPEVGILHLLGGNVVKALRP